MTLTKYQKGEAIDGWNDCPVYLPNNGSNSSISSNSSRNSRKRIPRIGHDINGNALSGTADASRSIPPMRTPPIGNSSSSVNLVQSSKSVDPQPSERIKTGEEFYGIASEESIRTKLQELLERPTTLQQKEINNYKNKLVNVQDSLSSDDKQFLNNILVQANKLQTGSDKETTMANIKKEILQYMMANDGVSSWCVSLRKTIEGLDLGT